MVVRAGYSKVFDRIGQGLALNFDQGFAFGMSTTISSPFGAPYETNPAVRFVAPRRHAARRCRQRLPEGSRRHRRSGRGSSRTSIDDTIVTPSAHMVNAIVGRELGGGFAFEGWLHRSVRPRSARPPRSRHAAEPGGYGLGHGLLHGSPAADQGHPGGRPYGQLAGRPPSQVLANIPYWQNLFPDANGIDGSDRHTGDRAELCRERAGLHHGRCGKSTSSASLRAPCLVRSRTSWSSTTRSRRSARSADRTITR